MTQLCYSFPVSFDLFWGHSTLLLTWLIFFGLLIQVLTSYDLFLGFQLKPLPRQTDLNQLMTQAVSRRLQSIQHIIQMAFQELTHNQPMTQVDSQVLIQIDLFLRMPPNFSIQINS